MHTVLVLPHQTVWHYSDGEPTNEGAEYKGDMKQEAQLSQRERAMLRVTEYFTKPMKLFRSAKVPVLL